MKRQTIYATIAATAFMLAAGLSFAAEGKTGASEEKAAAGKQKASDEAGKVAKKAKPAAKVKLVDINGASKQELAKLPGVSEADADKIIAGRPYGSKAWLVTHKILSEEIYYGLAKMVIAKQPYKDAAKNAEIYKKLQEKSQPSAVK